jgi:hypothetical protein
MLCRRTVLAGPMPTRAAAADRTGHYDRPDTHPARRPRRDLPGHATG